MSIIEYCSFYRVKKFFVEKLRTFNEIRNIEKKGAFYKRLQLSRPRVVKQTVQLLKTHDQSFDCINIKILLNEHHLVLFFLSKKTYFSPALAM